MTYPTQAGSVYTTALVRTHARDTSRHTKGDPDCKETRTNLNVLCGHQAFWPQHLPAEYLAAILDRAATVLMTVERVPT